MKKFRIGIIGCGSIAQTHIDILHDLSEYVDVVAACDIQPSTAQDFAEEHGIKYFTTDYTKILNNRNVDITLILLPHNMHATVAEQALLGNKHVILEKPVAGTVSDTRRILRALDRSNSKLMIANNLLFHPIIKRLQHLLQKAFLGTITHLEIRSRGWFQIDDPHNFRCSIAQSQGGALLDTGIHFVYLLRSLIGEIKAVESYTASSLNHMHNYPIEGDDISVTIIRFQSGIIGTMTISYSTKAVGWELPFPSGWDQGITLYGSEGNANVSISGNSISLFHEKTNATSQITPEIEDPYKAYMYSYRGEIEYFINCLRKGVSARPEVSLPSAIRDLEILKQAYTREKSSKNLSETQSVQ